MAPSKGYKRKSESPPDAVEKKRYSTRSSNKKSVNYEETEVDDECMVKEPPKKIVCSSDDDDFEMSVEEENHEDVPDEIHPTTKADTNTCGDKKVMAGNRSRKETSVNKKVVKNQSLNTQPHTNMGFKPVIYDVSKIKSELNLSDDSDSDGNDEVKTNQLKLAPARKEQLQTDLFEDVNVKKENNSSTVTEMSEVSNDSVINPWMKNLEALKNDCSLEESEAVSKEVKKVSPNKPEKKTKQSRRKKNTPKIENDQITVEEMLKLEKVEQSSSEEDDENWEKVKPSAPDQEPELPKSVEVTLEIPDARRKKKGMDIQNMIRLKINRIRKEIQLDLHQVSLVGLLAHGYLVNKMLSDPAIMGTALSIVPESGFPPARTDLNYLEKLVKWFSTHFKLDKSEKFQSLSPLKDRILKCIGTAKAQSIEELVFTCVTLCRSLGILARLVLSLQPLAAKVDSKELQPKSQSKKTTKSETDLPEKDTQSSTSKPKRSTKSPKGAEKEKVGQKSKSTAKKSADSASKDSPAAKPEAKPIITDKRKHHVSKTSKVKAEVLPSTKEAKQPKRSRRKSAEKPVKYEESPLDDTEEESTSGRKRSVSAKRTVSKEKPTKSKGKQDLKKTAAKVTSRRSQQSSSDEFEQSMSEDSENDEPSVSTQHAEKTSSSERSSRKIITPDSEATDNGALKQKKKVDVWMEVYLEQEEQWMSVDVVGAQIHCDRHLERHASEPLLYVVAFNEDLTWKDVTARYASSFLSTTRKQRAHPTWTKLLDLHREKASPRSKAEDESLEKSLTDRPMPTSISELKNHPLYALQRHLLKFEAIYPPTAIPVGFIRSEPVYARECVKNLHSRETWLKEAKVVRIGEKPYKIVKARPKWDRYSQKMITDQPLEVFGEWQVEDYIPPPAVDGIVPRNAYGNVELFLPSMLPKGTKHLQIPGLNKVARRLGIDCAPAMTGWDYHGGWSHPVYDGFVVCDEHVETLMDAWQAANQEQEQREREKIEKRVYGNWRRIIRGLLIREHLQAKYFRNLTEDDVPSATPEPSEPTPNATSQKGKTQKRSSIPNSRKGKKKM